jgi:hypothetical protein
MVWKEVESIQLPDSVFPSPVVDVPVDDTDEGRAVDALATRWQWKI